MVRLLIFALVVGAVVYVMNRSAAERPLQSSSGELTLRYGKSLRIFSTSMLVLSIFVVQQLIRQGTFTDAWFALLAMIAMLWLTLETWVARIVLSEDELRCRSPWRPSRHIKWTDVEVCRFSEKLQRWVLETRNQGKVRLSAMLIGADAVRTYVERRGITVQGDLG